MEIVRSVEGFFPNRPERFIFLPAVSGLYVSFILGFGFDDSRVGLRSPGSYLFVISAFHALPEAFYRTAQIAAEIAEFLGAEYQNNNQQNDQPMPNAE